MKLAPSHLAISEATFLDVLKEYSAHFPYASFQQPVPVEQDIPFLVPNERSIVRFLPSKSRWYLFEFLGFEGADFAYAVTRSLCQRAPTDNELQRLSGGDAWKKLDFVLELHELNKKSGNRTLLQDARYVVFVWRTTRWLGKSRIPLLSRRAKSYYRRYAGRLIARAAEATTSHRLLYQCIDRLDMLAKRLEAI